MLERRMGPLKRGAWSFEGIESSGVSEASNSSSIHRMQKQYNETKVKLPISFKYVVRTLGQNVPLEPAMVLRRRISSKF